MKLYFVIGGMGSGKSTVTALLAEEGGAILDLDEVGHEVLSDPSLQHHLAATFGSSIIAPEGGIDRKALASVAFASPASTEKLAALTAPFIAEKLSLWRKAREQEGNALAFVEASAFTDKDKELAAMADGIIAVRAPYEERIRRACGRGFSEQDVKRRIESQPTDDERAQWADFSITNDGGIEHLRKQVAAVRTTIAKG